MNLLMILFCCLTFERLAWSQHNVRGTVNIECESIVCSCCSENVKCIIEQYGSCGGQCKVGYFGGRCRNNCPNNCVACQDPYNPNSNFSLIGVANCTQCKPGYYSTPEFYQCQFNCSTACQTCTSDTTCDYCKDGYYLSGKVCYPCPTVCRYCKSIDHCLSCQRGFHLSDGVCSSCPEPCTSCTSLSQCTECKDGFYISDADIGVRNCRPCSIGCVSGQCNKTSGICQCRDTFTRDKCDRCVDGRFGEDCLSYCPVNCRFDNCDKNSGSCLGGCFDGFSGDQCCLKGSGCQICASEHLCAECVHGRYGSVCEKDCPVDCENNVCYKDTGVCHAVRESRKSDNNGAVVGGVVAGALVVIVIVVVVVVLCRRRGVPTEHTSSNADSSSVISDNSRCPQNKVKDVQLEMTHQSNQMGTDTLYQNPSYQNLDSPDTDDSIYVELQDEGSR